MGLKIIHVLHGSLKAVVTDNVANSWRLASLSFCYRNFSITQVNRIRQCTDQLKYIYLTVLMAAE